LSRKKELLGNLLKKGHKKRGISKADAGNKKFFQGDLPDTASHKEGFVIYNNKDVTSPHSSKFTSARKEDSIFKSDTGRGTSVSARKPNPVAMVELSKQRQFLTPKVSRANLKSDRVYETPKEFPREESFQKISIDLKRSSSKKTLESKQGEQKKKKKATGRSQSRDRATSPSERVLSPKSTVSEPKYVQPSVYSQPVIRSPKQPQETDLIQEMRIKTKEILNDINDLDQEIMRYNVNK